MCGIDTVIFIGWTSVGCMIAIVYQGVTSSEKAIWTRSDSSKCRIWLVKFIL